MTTLPISIPRCWGVKAGNTGLDIRSSLFLSSRAWKTARGLGPSRLEGVSEASRSLALDLADDPPLESSWASTVGCAATMLGPAVVGVSGVAA